MPVTKAWSERLKHALALDVPHLHGVLPKPRGKKAAVLVLVSADGELLFVERARGPDHHSGQIAFPGGGIEGDESPLEAALREAEEEVALPRQAVTPLGTLPPLWTFVSDYWIEPNVGLLSVSQHSLALRPSPEEIAQCFWFPLSELPNVYALKNLRGFQNHTFATPHGEVWGATGALVFNLAARLGLLG